MSYDQQVSQISSPVQLTIFSAHNLTYLRSLSDKPVMRLLKGSGGLRWATALASMNMPLTGPPVTKSC